MTKNPVKQRSFYINRHSRTKLLTAEHLIHLLLSKLGLLSFIFNANSRQFCTSSTADAFVLIKYRIRLENIVYGLINRLWKIFRNIDKYCLRSFKIRYNKFTYIVTDYIYFHQCFSGLSFFQRHERIPVYLYREHLLYTHTSYPMQTDYPTQAMHLFLSVILLSGPFPSIPTTASTIFSTGFAYLHISISASQNHRDLICSDDIQPSSFPV